MSPIPRPSWRRYTRTPRPASAIIAIALCNCAWQSQRCEPKTSPVRHSLCTRTRTGSSPRSSDLTSAMWVTCVITSSYAYATTVPYSVGSVVVAPRSTSRSLRRRYAMMSSTATILIECSAAKASRSGRRAMRPSARITSQMTPAGKRPASLHRSTIASVWPARSSTPPAAARSGNVCPGLAKSLGLACSSQSRRMVVARSKALMPVVTPWPIASTVTVNAVPKRDVLSSTIAPTPSSSRRQPSTGTQMSPRPCVAMKLTASGVIRSAAIARSPSFSRSSSSTMITNLPALMSAMASSTLARLIGSPLARRALEGAALVSRGERSSDVARDQVDLEVHPRRHPPGAGDRLGEGDGDERHRERRVEHIHNREADAVDGDAALLGDEVDDVVGRRDGHPAGVCVLAQRRDDAGGVDVPGHHVTADSVAESEGTLDVDRRAVCQPAQRGALERLGHDVGCKTLIGNCRDREAGAIDSDALADLEAREGRPRHDLDPAERLRPYRAEGFDDPAEHFCLILDLSVHSIRSPRDRDRPSRPRHRQAAPTRQGS